jgi:hypothetical protein
MSRPRSWLTVTCTICGAIGPGRPKLRLCRRCYARRVHPMEVCPGCNQLRRRLAAGLCQRCYRLSRTRQRRCGACDEVRPVYFGGRCERCKQRARLHPGRCQRCGQQATLSGQYCRACIERASQTAGACRDCLCWTGLIGGRCRPCRLFGYKHQVGGCLSCGRQVPLGSAGRCRLCLATSRATGAIPPLQASIQLFLLVAIPARVPPRHCEVEQAPRPTAGLGQLRLPRTAAGARISVTATPAARPRSAPSRPQPRLVGRRDRRQRQRWHWEAALAAYAQPRGWSPDTLRHVRRSLEALFTAQPPTATSPPDAGTVRQFLIERHLTALRTIEFLADQGLVTLNPDAALERWLQERLEPLPAQIRAEVLLWVNALRGRGPRAGQPRKATTIQGYLRAAEPALAEWAARYRSLRQITRDDIAAQLQPLTGPTRLLVLAVMRSLFKTLKAQRVVFANPTAGLEGRHEPPPPALSLDPAHRAALLGQLHRPDARLIVLLAGVHALRPYQIRVLALDDVDPAVGTLRVGGQPRRLDALTLEALRAWLELRRARWPRTANPYLLVNQSTANGSTPVNRHYVQEVFQRLGLTAEAARVDRLLAEVHATGGDPLKLARLFGLSDPTAIRYCLELGPLDQPEEPQQDRKFGELTATNPPKSLQ